MLVFAITRNTKGKHGSQNTSFCADAQNGRECLRQGGGVLGYRRYDHMEPTAATQTKFTALRNGCNYMYGNVNMLGVWQTLVVA